MPDFGIEHSTHASETYHIYTDSGVTYAKSGLTGSIFSSGTNPTTVIQAAITSLAGGTGGLIHIAKGVYGITAQLTVPQHSGYSITIEGEGWRNTRLEWTAALDAGAYLLESYSTDAAGWQVVTIKDIQFYGGPSTSDRRVKVLHIGRTNSAAAAIYYFHNVRVANGTNSQITANFIQDSYWRGFYAESYTGTPTAIIDLAVTSSSHINCYGCTFGAVTIDSSRLNYFGGTIGYLDLKVIANYTCKIDGTAFDPVPVGLTHQVQVGSTGNVVGATFENCTHLADTNTPATHRYYYINNASNCVIRNPHFSSASTVATYIEITSSATGTIVWFPTQIALTKISDAGITSAIYSPRINNNFFINNPSGTLGASVLDAFTSNRIELANSGLHIDLAAKLASASTRIRFKSRNGANSADVIRLFVGNLANQGAAPITALENIVFSGGVTVVPFIKAGIPADGDFLNPVSGMVALDTTNSVWYARVGSTWTALGGHVISVAKGGTGATTLTGVLKGNGTSAVTAAAQLAVADGGTGAATLTGILKGNGTSAFTALTDPLPIANGGTSGATATAGFDALSGMTALGDTHYGGASGTRSILAGNITTVRQYLSQTGSGAASAAPVWVTPKSVGVWQLLALTHAVQTIIYVPLVNGFTNATEANVDLIFDYTFTVKRFRLSVQLNTKTANTVFSFRDDAADVAGTPITVATGVTGEQDSGALSVDVAAGSKINWKIDATASASGSIVFFGWVEYEIALQ